MSREDVGTVRASYEALNGGDVEGALGALHPDVEWRESRELPETDVYRGIAAVRGLLDAFMESWLEFHQDVDEAIEAGDKVVVLLHLSAIGRESGARVDARYAHVWTIRDGKGVRVDAFYDRGEALKTAGVGSERGARSSA